MTQLKNVATVEAIPDFSGQHLTKRSFKVGMDGVKSIEQLDDGFILINGFRKIGPSNVVYADVQPSLPVESPTPDRRSDPLTEQRNAATSAVVPDSADSEASQADDTVSVAVDADEVCESAAGKRKASKKRAKKTAKKSSRSARTRRGES